MKRASRIAVVAAAAVVIAGCGGQQAPANPATSEQKGQYGVFYFVSVSRPEGGTIRTADGRLNCGTLGGPNNLCAPISFLWADQAVLTAVPDAGQYFQAWAGDCSELSTTCTLGTASGGADKWAAAVFNPPGQLGHGKITSPSVHAPMFFAFLGNVAGAPRCNTCHGQNYGGLANAPSCNNCHAAAGWANWQQNCSFCHGAKNATTKAGYAFADGGINQEWAAPPDDVNGRLTGANGNAVGAHQAHVAANDFRSTIACSECHVVPATAIHTLNASLDLPFGPLSRSQGAVPLWDAGTLTCSANYCHGNFNYGGVQGKAASLNWMGTLTGCTTCHDMPPTGHMPVTGPDGTPPAPSACSGCHPDTVTAAGAIDLVKGKHINGQKDVSGGGACDSCHWFPNSLTRSPTGAHLAHFGLTATQASTGYGDLDTLELKYPTATPTTAPANYGFGCGNCHPATDPSRHMDGVTQVSLFEATAPATSLKARNAATASFDSSARTCSGVYCHSSGNDGSPIYVTTPSWLSTEKLACSGCHANPPRYTSGGAGTATANSHLQFSADAASPWGHYAFVMTERRYTQHGRGNAPNFLNWSQIVYSDAAPITCQTCHFDTTDPSSTGPSGFYWLDTTGDYALLPNAWNYAYVCASCHSAASPTAPLGQGRVLPLRHVNGSRDVQFDSRTGDPGASQVPSPDRPVRPYWFTQGSTTSAWWINTNRTMVGTTAQFDLSPARFDPVQKTCTNVTCHMAQGNTGYTGTTPSTRFEVLRWGAPYYVSTNDPVTGRTTCSACHRGM